MCWPLVRSPYVALTILPHKFCGMASPFFGFAKNQVTHPSYLESEGVSEWVGLSGEDIQIQESIPSCSKTVW